MTPDSNQQIEPAPAQVLRSAREEREERIGAHRVRKIALVADQHAIGEIVGRPMRSAGKFAHAAGKGL